MALRKSLLRQHIQRALMPAHPTLLLALGALASQPVTPLQAADVHYEWSCRPAANGQGWECREQAVSGPAYQRPQHASTRRSASAADEPAADKRSRQQPRHLAAAEVDWIPAEQLTESQRQALTPGCCGAYIEPERTDSDAQLEPEQAPLRADADSSEWLQESTAVLKGDVKLTQGYRQLEADQATLNQTDNTVQLEGDVRLREPGVLVTGSRADTNLDTSASRIENASYLVHDARLRGDSKSLSLSTERVMTLEDGSFTRCEPDSDTWYLRGSEIKIDPNTNQGTGKHVRLNLLGVPVFYTPWIRFPVSDERMSGFLFPSLSSTDGNGVDLAVPYYFNLAPNYDMTLTPRYISDRGEMLEAEVRHLSTQFETSISTAYLGSDEGGDDPDRQDLVDDGTLTAAEAFPYRDEDRWLLNVDQIGGKGARWYSRIDYTTVSDVDYFRDLDNASLEVNSATHLRKLGILGYRANNWLYEIQAEEFETLSTIVRPQYKQLPRVRVEGDYRVLGDWVIDLDHEYVNFDHRDTDEQPIITGERARLDYGLAWDKRWIWGFFKPGAKVISLNYQLDDEYLNPGANDAPSFTAAQASLDTGLFFEREGSLLGNGYQQTFEPRLFYFHSERENQDELINVSGNRDVDFDTTDLTFSYQQLFRDTRFTGGDRIDDDERLSVGLTSRFIDSRGIERFSASIGQIFYFEDRGISITETEAATLAREESQRDDSQYAAQILAQLGNYWRFNADVMWDADDSDRVSRGSASLRYQDEDYRLFNLGYRYVRRDPFDSGLNTQFSRTIEQGDVSFVLPLWGNWNAIGRANYDFTHDRELESLFGVEYNDCCYRVRLVARKWLDNELVNTINDLELEEDEGIFLEFQLKGLGNLGSKVSDILSDGIYGFEDREQNLR